MREKWSESRKNSRRLEPIRVRRRESDAYTRKGRKGTEEIRREGREKEGRRKSEKGGRGQREFRRRGLKKHDKSDFPSSYRRRRAANDAVRPLNI